MNTKQDEIQNLLQEECAELIMAISKCRRFGLIGNQESLIQEMGDVSLLIQLLVDELRISHSTIDDAKRAKAEKLRQWSNIYN